MSPSRNPTWARLKNMPPPHEEVIGIPRGQWDGREAFCHILKAVMIDGLVVGIYMYKSSLLAAATLDPISKVLALSSDVEEALSLLQCCVGVSSRSQRVSVDALCL